MTKKKKGLSTEERELIVDQALILIEQFYVHLPLKRAMHAVDPIQRLKLLKHRLKKIDERAFHTEMILIFTRLRDLHTIYLLPEPFNNAVAYLPFRVQEFFRGRKNCQYVVTQVSKIVKDAYFKPGIIITHWNGIPISRAVEISADREAGSNPEARHACGLEALTVRPLAMSLPPDEDWVTVTYKAGRKSREKTFYWEFGRPRESSGWINPLTSSGRSARMYGLDVKAELERRVRKVVFTSELIDEENMVLDAWKRRHLTDAHLSTVSIMPDVFSFRAVNTPSGKFGYVRIHTFNVDDDVPFVNEFIRILGLLPQRGLILDVRKNPGGYIVAGERLLQLLTPKRIEPARLHFINTPLTLRLCEKDKDVAQWRESIAQAVETGATFSQGYPLLPVEKYNDIGQKYYGPVVLVTDALCYSTTDIFSAGFQDHKIGTILGTSGNTGAGGANVWDHDVLRRSLRGRNSPLLPLPRKASFQVAIRRTTRVGEQAGVPLEDLGVIPDKIHLLTRKDVLYKNVDLINHAAKILAKFPTQFLSAEVKKLKNGVSVVVTTNNVSRVDVLLDERPRKSFDVSGGITKFRLTSLPHNSKVLNLQGFRKDQLVASAQVELPVS